MMNAEDMMVTMDETMCERCTVEPACHYDKGSELVVCEYCRSVLQEQN